MDLQMINVVAEFGRSGSCESCAEICVLMGVTWKHNDIKRGCQGFNQFLLFRRNCLFADLAVFATTAIAARTKFGPLEGDLRFLLAAELELMKSDCHRRLPVLFVNHNCLVDVSNECNDG